MRVTCVLAMLSASALMQVSTAQQPSVMKDDVARMVRAAHKLDRLMPWSKPVTELDRVVRHGRAVAPFLLTLLPDDPDESVPSPDRWDEGRILAGEQFDWHVQQHAAVALCRIYRVPPADCVMYSNRATREHNRSVKRLWVKKISEDK